MLYTCGNVYHHQVSAALDASKAREAGLHAVLASCLGPLQGTLLVCCVCVCVCVCVCMCVRARVHV